MARINGGQAAPPGQEASCPRRADGGHPHPSQEQSRPGCLHGSLRPWMHIVWRHHFSGPRCRVPVHLIPGQARYCGLLRCWSACSVGSSLMGMSMPTPAVTGGGTRLIGRAVERAVLERLLAAVRGGESQALVLLGEPGIGKTALLEELAKRASGCCRMVSVSGVQSEMELTFAVRLLTGCCPAAFPGRHRRGLCRLAGPGTGGGAVPRRWSIH